MGTAASAVRSSEARLSHRGCRRSRISSLPFAHACTANGAGASEISSLFPNGARRIAIIVACLAPWRVNRTSSSGVAPKRPPRLTSRRIGIHTSSAGGVQNAAERAYRLGCNTFQIFSSSPRQWAPYELGELQCAEMNRLRARYDLKPLVIHTNYLVNLASSNELFLQKSMEAFRGEVDAGAFFVRGISGAASRLVSWG